MNVVEAMKHHFSLALVFAVFFTLILLTPVPQADAETLEIASGEWAPWAGADLKENGFVCHVVTEVFERAGYDVAIDFYPWSRAEAMIKNGKADASAYWYLSEERKEFSYYSDPITEERIVFFYHKSSDIDEWETLQDLSSYTIGVSQGNTYTDEFWEQGRQGPLTFDEANDDRTNFRKLLGGRIDIFPCAEVVGHKILRDHFSEVAGTVETLEKPLSVANGHLIFPKSKPDSRRLRNEFNQHLADFKDEGTYDQYMNKMFSGYYSE